MGATVRTLVHEYGGFTSSLGLPGNAAFFFGSLLFLPALQADRTIAVRLFISGSFLMFLGSLGRL